MVFSSMDQYLATGLKEFTVIIALLLPKRGELMISNRKVGNLFHDPPIEFPVALPDGFLSSILKTLCGRTGNMRTYGNVGGPGSWESQSWIKSLHS